LSGEETMVRKTVSRSGTGKVDRLSVPVASGVGLRLVAILLLALLCLAQSH
jgi:hypothetical protein